MNRPDDDDPQRRPRSRDLLGDDAVRPERHEIETWFRGSLPIIKGEVPPLSAYSAAPGTRPGNGRVALVAASALDQVRELQRIGCEGGLAERNDAQQALADVARTVARSNARRRSEQPPLIGFGAGIEARVRDLRWRLLELSGSNGDRSVNRLAHRVLPIISVMLTFGTSVAIAVDSLAIALVLATVRIGLAVFAVSAGLPSDLDSKRAMWTADWRACVVGHLADASVLLGVAGLLLAQGRTMWGWAVALVAISLLASTLLRVAALQGGTWLGRLYLERVLRLGWVWIGLVCAVTWQPSIPSDGGFPLLVLTGVGAAMFTAIETTRTLVYARSHERRQRRQSPAENFNDHLGAWFLATEQHRDVGISWV